MPSTELITVVVGGKRYTAWKSVEVRAAVHEACRTYTLEVAAEAGPTVTAATFPNFAPLAIYAGGDLILKGYVDSRKPKLTKTSAEITISGRSKAQDAVDCSAIHATGRFQKKSVLQIAQELDIYDVGYSSDLQFDPIEEFQLTPGETVHREIERLCRDEAVTLAGQPDGGVKLWNASAGMKRQAGAIVEGVNLYEANADHNCENRHSHTHVRGQSARGHGKGAHALEGVAQDSGVPRKRHIVHVHDANTDSKRIKKRATHRRDRAAGNGLKASVTMIGWRDDAGQIWTPGNRVWTQSPYLDIAQDMLIQAVVYSQTEGDEGGTHAHLELVDPRAYGGKAGGRSKSGAEWSIDDSDAQ